MDYRYLIRDKHRLAQVIATNLLPKGYWFYATAWIPAGKDPEVIDAKLILLYGAHLSKSKAYRKRKGGVATVRYLRLGRLCILMSTKGTSPFFDREDWKDARVAPICFGGYSIGVNRDTGKVSVRLHREAQRRLKRFILTWGNRRSREWWERFFKNFPFLPFAGVRDNVFALLRHLNACRKHFRQPPVEWENCVRKKFTPQPAFLDSPPEVIELLRYEARKR